MCERVIRGQASGGKAGLVSDPTDQLKLLKKLMLVLGLVERFQNNTVKDLWLPVRVPTLSPPAANIWVSETTAYLQESNGVHISLAEGCLAGQEGGATQC